jgi:hypothetical protein
MRAELTPIGFIDISKNRNELWEVGEASGRQALLPPVRDQILLFILGEIRPNRLRTAVEHWSAPTEWSTLNVSA